MDQFDLKILRILQEDAAITVGELAERIGLSATPCWRRVQKLEASGVLRGRVALLDAEKINCGVTVIVRVHTNQHNQQWLERFAAGVAAIEEITEVYRLSGDIDYILKIVVPDIARYDEVYKRLIAAADFADVSSSFVMETIKQTTVLPLKYAQS